MNLLPSLTNPVLLSIFYRTGNDYHAALSIKGSNEPDSTLTVIYDSLLEGIRTFTFAGDQESEQLTVQDCELISVIARRDSLVVGVGVFQVDIALTGSHGLILAPMACINMDVDQADEALVVRGTGHSITAEYAELAEGSQVL